jgi:general secretion pathway protein I
VRGFTLLEVMVALAIVAGVLTTVLASFVHHLDLAARDRDETTAMLLARAKIDESRFRNERTGQGTFAPSWPDLAWKLSTEPAPWPGVEKLKLVVSWNQGRDSLPLVHYREKLP